MSENNTHLSERSIKGSLSKTILDEIDSIFIEDSTESIDSVESSIKIESISSKIVFDRLPLIDLSERWVLFSDIR